MKPIITRFEFSQTTFITHTHVYMPHIAWQNETSDIQNQTDFLEPLSHTYI